MDRVRAKVAFLIISLCLSGQSFCVTNQVNILTWWGYLTPEIIKDVENKCNIKVSVDEYYSSSEFLRRWEENVDGNDLIIFSNTIYNVIKTKIKKINRPDLLATPYHPLVMEKTSKLNLERNTRLLALSFTGLLWKKGEMTINEEKSLKTILDESKDKFVVVLDDAMEGLQILESLNYFQSQSRNSGKKATRLVIANDLKNLVKQSNFGFAYHWSGGVISIMKDNPDKFNFIVHPKLSHVTADLITVNNEKRGSICAFNIISNKETSLKIQNKSLYFSPFGGVGNGMDEKFNSLYRRYFLNLKKYRWLGQPTKQEFKEINDKWKVLKVKLNEN